ncbi:hypothetical protein IJ531_04430, partial [bacterium]|nr:hypothetical protein [bacterium]
LIKQVNFFKDYLKHSLRDPVKSYKKRNRSFVFWDNLSKAEQFEKSLYIERFKKVYKYVSVKPDFNKKYIYVPLHQEPEASIMARSLLSCQIFIIKMLSEVIPKDWKIYVKEHPAEFDIYKVAPYFYRNIEYFRSGDFYYQIKKLKNVEMIDIDVNSSLLLENAQSVC